MLCRAEEVGEGNWKLVKLLHVASASSHAKTDKANTTNMERNEAER